MLLAATLGSGKKRRYYSFGTPEPAHATPHSTTSKEKHQLLETWDTIKSALIAVAATRVKEYVGEVLPGFKEHFEQAQQKKASV